MTDPKLPPELSELFSSIGHDVEAMQQLIEHGVDHAPEPKIFEAIKDILEDGCPIGNVIMLLALALQRLDDLELTTPQQALLIGIYAQQCAQGREQMRKEENPKLN